MTSLFGVPLDAAYHLVSGFTVFLTPVLGGLAAVAAIIAFTMAVRIILMPLSLRAMRGQAVQARLAPQLQALRKRYARQPERLQREMAALYKREGTSMFAGLTPLLLQWPLLSVIYLLFRSGQVGGKTNTLLTHDLLGVPLGSHWLGGAGPLSAQGLVFLGAFVLLAGLCWLSSRLGQLMATQAAAAPVPAKGAPAKVASAPSAPAKVASAAPAPAKGAPAKGAPAPSAPAKGAPAPSAPAKVASAPSAPAKGAPAVAAPAKRAPAVAAPVQGGALVKVLPYLTVLIAAFAPLAAGIYLITSTGWSLAERRFFWRSAVASGGQPATPRRLRAKAKVS